MLRAAWSVTVYADLPSNQFQMKKLIQGLQICHTTVFLMLKKPLSCNCAHPMCLQHTEKSSSVWHLTQCSSVKGFKQPLSHSFFVSLASGCEVDCQNKPTWQFPAGFAQSLKVLESLGKMGYAFQGLESLKTEWGLWKFVNFVVFRALGKNYQLISQKLHFPRLNSSLTKNKFAVRNQEECTRNQFWLIECVGHQLHQALHPFTGCAEEFRTFVLLFCAILQRFVKSLWILKGFFCTNPVQARLSYIEQGQW